MTHACESGRRMMAFSWFSLLLPNLQKRYHESSEDPTGRFELVFYFVAFFLFPSVLVVFGFLANDWMMITWWDDTTWWADGLALNVIKFLQSYLLKSLIYIIPFRRFFRGSVLPFVKFPCLCQYVLEMFLFIHHFTHDFTVTTNIACSSIHMHCCDAW